MGDDLTPLFSRLPSTLGSLELSALKLSTIPPLHPTFPHLYNLGLSNSNLQQLPTPSPHLLKELDINGIQFTHFPDNVLPLGLTTIHMSRNQLTELPSLPPRLIHLNYSFNQLTHLPPFPKSPTSYNYT